MSAAQSGRIDAFLKRAHKCGFSKELLTVNGLVRVIVFVNASANRWLDAFDAVVEVR